MNIEECRKRDITLDPFDWTSNNLCHAYRHAIGNMRSKCHSDDLKTVGGVSDTTIHNQTNHLTNRLLTQI